MYKFIQRNQKKFLAVFGVLLMIVFIIPSTAKYGSGGNDPLRGTVGSVKIYGSDEGRAKEDLRALRQAQFQPLLQLGGPSNPNDPLSAGVVYQGLEQHPLTYALLQHEARQNGVQVSDDQVTRAMESGLPLTRLGQSSQEGLRDAVERFLLVQSQFERAAGAIKVSRPEVRYQTATQAQDVKFNVVELSASQFLDRVPAPTAEQVRQFYEKYAGQSPQSGGFASTQPSTPGYLVPDRFKIQYLDLPADRTADAFLATLDKTKNEIWPLELAAYNYYTTHQSEFRAPAEPAPTTSPTTPPTTAPATAPAAGPATAPATQAAAAPPTTAPATRTAATQPTTRPFAEVKTDAIRRVLLGAAGAETTATNRDVKGLRDRYTAFATGLQNELHDQLAKDYQAYAASLVAANSRGAQGGLQGAAGPATAPTTGPTVGPAAAAAAGVSSVGVPYDSVEYLERVADAFEKQHGVRPLVTSIANEWKTAQDLQSLPKIGSARAGNTSFAQLVANQITRPAQPTTAAATGPATNPATNPATRPASDAVAAATTGPTTAPAALAAPGSPTSQPAVATANLFAPSPVLVDADHDAFIFRLSAFEPQHRPELAEVEPQIVKELKSAAAYDMAKSEARKLMETAQAAGSRDPNSRGGLPAIAGTNGYKSVTAGPAPLGVLTEIANRTKPGMPVPFQLQFELALQPQRLMPGYTGYLPDDPGARFTFFSQIAPLPAKATTKDPHPATVIELPNASKVVVAEVADFELAWPEQRDFEAQLSIAAALRQQTEAAFASNWFDPDNVAARVNFVPVERGSRKGKS